MLELILPKISTKKIMLRIKNPTKMVLHLFHIYLKAYQNNKNNISRIINELGALEYHYEKHKKLEKKANNGRFYRNDLSYEAEAYITHLGKLFYFFNSCWFGTICDKKKIAITIPTILALLPIRNKITVHNQNDDSRNDDCSSPGLNSHGLFPIKSGRINDQKIKIKYSFPTKQRCHLLKRFHPSPVTGIEFFGKENMIIEFIPSEQHSIIANEIFTLLKHFLKKSS